MKEVTYKKILKVIEEGTYSIDNCAGEIYNKKGEKIGYYKKIFEKNGKEFWEKQCSMYLNGVKYEFNVSNVIAVNCGLINKDNYKEYRISFKDKDTENTRENNLCLMTKSEQIRNACNSENYGRVSLRKHVKTKNYDFCKKVYDMLNEGNTIEELAIKLEVSKSTIRRALEAYEKHPEKLIIARIFDK